MDWRTEIQNGSLSFLMESLTKLSEDSELRIVLNSGHQLTGVPLRVDQKNGMFLFELRSTPPAEIAWVPFSSVSYVHLVNPAGSLRGITGGKLTRDPASPGIPSLELKRKAAKTFEGMRPEVEILWPEKMSGPESLGLSDFIDSLQLVLSKLQQDPMGKDALAGLKKIIVTSSGDFSAAVAQDILSISFSAAVFDGVQREQLLATIEQAL